MIEELSYPFDSNLLLRKRVSLRKKLLAEDVKWVEKRIAVFGGATTQDIISYIELFLLDAGIRPAFYESNYNQYWEDAMFGNPELDAFRPDVVFVATGTYNIKVYPELSDDKAAVEAMLSAEYGRYETMWEKLREKFGCPIIQNNFEMPAYRILGNADGWDVHGRTYFVNELNRRFGAYARSHSGFYINDVCWQSAAQGLENWNSPKHYHLYKSPANLTCLPYLGMNVAHIIKAIFGKNKKAVVLDLDNTLWGGVIGDEGVEGIALGSDTSVGQAYNEFQQYIKAVGSTGVLLCIDSKNDQENALVGLNHPDCRLRPDDFVIIKANWTNKDVNLSEIVTTLNIGSDSVIFVDDNPVERGVVRASFPEVAAPDIGQVEDYIRVIDRNGYFESVGISQDDLKRADMYRNNVTRSESEKLFADYGDYLNSLAMTAEIAPFNDIYLQRITQLANKTNQFNLTTRRYTQTEIEACMADGNCITLYGKLEDKYGDNGLVCVMIGRCNGDIMDVELFLMSCRVLKRGMEAAMMNAFVGAAKKKGVAKVRGFYYPTAKNGMVKDLYQELGFTKVSETDEGTVWEMDAAGYEPLTHQIAVKE